MIHVSKPPAASRIGNGAAVLPPSPSPAGHIHKSPQNHKYLKLQPRLFWLLRSLQAEANKLLDADDMNILRTGETHDDPDSEILTSLPLD